MHRALLLQLLHNYTPEVQSEKDFKQEIITFASTHPDCFERSLTLGHITASSWLLNRNNTHALLMHHRKLDRWVQLGGHCDGDPDVLGVAIKEAQEESGIIHIAPISSGIFDIDIHLIPDNPREKQHFHYDIRFLLQVTSNETFISNSESKELRWVSKDPTAMPTQEISVMRMFNKWITRAL